MSYSIIFETRIVRLTDGRILHLDRSGCNNDTAGRKRDEFFGTIYTEEAFIAKAESFMADSKPYQADGPFDLKVLSRPATFHDYGTHLLRMLRRAEKWSYFISRRHVSAKYCEAIELLAPEQKMMPPAEFDELWPQLLRDSKEFSYRRVMQYPDIKDEAGIVRLLESGTPLEFYVSTKVKGGIRA